eukprot:scaffold15468_cov87-Cyclotella_meneghiniana.AAC.4
MDSDSNDLSKPLLHEYTASGINESQKSETSLRQSQRNRQRRRQSRRKSTQIKRTVRRKSQAISDVDMTRLTATSLDDTTSVFSETPTERRSNVDDTNKNIMDEEEEELPITMTTKVKSACVILTTIVAVTGYVLAFPEAILVMSVPAINLTMLGTAAGICVVLTPMIWFNEWKLIRYPALRRITNSLRQEALNLNKEINFLNYEDSHIDKLVDLVEENLDIMDAMREYLRQAVLQDIIKNILRSDEDRDGMLNKVEAKALEARLKLSLDAYGVVFDVEKFHRAIGLSPSLCSVIAIVKRLLPDENNRLSSFYSVDSEDDECDSDDDEDEDDFFDMFYIPVEKETKVLAPDTLRICGKFHEKMGRRPTLLSLAQQNADSIRRLRCEMISFNDAC